MFSILHITDLHRSKNDPLSNAELISALISDRDRYINEDPPVKGPEAIVVSGDLIQGVGLDAPNFEKELEAQYDEAHDFLCALTDRFIGGDRSKVIIIPGNHDIDWNVAKASMTAVPESEYPKNLPWALYEAGSLYRWDWKTLRLFMITDREKYRNRLAAFWKFFERFYAGVLPEIRPKSWLDANLHSLDEGRIGIAAFNSCATNDCFAFQGEVRRDVIAKAHLDLGEIGAVRLRIAVWHHDIQGPPHRSDYMDSELVRGMIGRGFRLGLYGHQHKTQITPERIYLPDEETMAIASAGSLCAGASDLPTGSNRGYSIVEVHDDYNGARIHVREMSYGNLFSRASLRTFGGKSYVDLTWKAPPDLAGRRVDQEKAWRNSRLSAAERALREDNDARRAIDILEALNTEEDHFARGLWFAAVEALSDPGELVRLIDPPRSIDELVALVTAKEAISDYDGAEQVLLLHATSLELPENLLNDMLQKINMNRLVKS